MLTQTVQKLSSDFTVGDLLGKFRDNFYEIKILEYNDKDLCSGQWSIPPYKVNQTELPERVKNAKVQMLALFFNCMSIEIKGK